MRRIELHTERLLIRPWQLGDVEDAFDYASDPEWGRYLFEVPKPYTRADAAAFVERATRDPWTEQAQFAIVLEGRVIGGVRLYLIEAASGIAGLGYNLAREHWNKGIATEAASAVLEHAFRDLELREVISTADMRNLASVRVMTKLGMQEKPLTSRAKRLFRGVYVDEVRYSISREDWLANSWD